MPLAAPVSLEEISARFDALNVGDRFAIAVSGGRDSMALARLCADYGKCRGADVAAFIVDHGLRDGSADEAAQAKKWCEAAGLRARILEWRGAKPANGVQAAARNARYVLLAHAAAELGLSVILTAHSADDQAETVLMRLMRGAGPAGLAAMEDEVCIAAGADDPVRLVRPLLPFSRDRLTATVDAYKQSYIDDPSNDDPTYERVRVRSFLRNAREDALVDRDALLRTAKRMATTRRELQQRDERKFLALGGVFARWGGASMDLQLLSQKVDGAGSLIARLIRAVSGGDHGPDVEAAATHLDRALASGAATLGGAILKTSGTRFWVLREPAAILGRAGAAPLVAAQTIPGRGILWDGRFILSTGAALTVRPLGPEGARLVGPATALFEGPKEGLLSLPGLYQGDRLIGAPGVLFGESGAWSARSLAAERFFGGIIRFLTENA